MDLHLFTSYKVTSIVDPATIYIKAMFGKTVGPKMQDVLKQQSNRQLYREFTARSNEIQTLAETFDPIDEILIGTR